MKDELFDKQKTEDSKVFAAKLNLTFEDFGLLVYDILPIEGNDGEIYGTKIEFDLERSPKKVLKKIKGLIDGRWIEI